MSEELTLLQKLMTSKPPTRRITSPRATPCRCWSSKPPTRRITVVTPKGYLAYTSKPPTRRITATLVFVPLPQLLSRLHGG